MNMLSLLAVLACAAAATPSEGAPSSTAASSVERVLVFSLNAEGVDARLVRSIERAVVQAADDAGYDALSNQDIASVLDIEAAKQAAGCEGTSSCLAEIAGGMGASLVVTGTVVALDASHFELSLTLLGDNATRVLARASGTASSTGDLRDEATRTANRLWAAARDGDPSSSSSSSSDHTGAVVWIGAGTVGVVGGAVVGVLGALNAINAVNAKAATERAATAYKDGGSNSDAAERRPAGLEQLGPRRHDRRRGARRRWTGGSRRGRCAVDGIDRSHGRPPRLFARPRPRHDPPSASSPSSSSASPSPRVHDLLKVL